MNLNHASALAAAAGGLAIAAGAWSIWSIGIGLIVGGVLAVAAAVVLYDPKTRR